MKASFLYNGQGLKYQPTAIKIVHILKGMVSKG